MLCRFARTCQSPAAVCVSPLPSSAIRSIPPANISVGPVRWRGCVSVLWMHRVHDAIQAFAPTGEIVTERTVRVENSATETSRPAASGAVAASDDCGATIKVTPTSRAKAFFTGARLRGRNSQGTFAPIQPRCLHHHAAHRRRSPTGQESLRQTSHASKPRPDRSPSPSFRGW